MTGETARGGRVSPCPFCGESDDLTTFRGTPDREGIPAGVTCGRCGAAGPWLYIEHEPLIDDVPYMAARSGWNNRVECDD